MTTISKGRIFFSSRACYPQYSSDDIAKPGMTPINDLTETFDGMVWMVAFVFPNMCRHLMIYVTVLATMWNFLSQRLSGGLRFR